MVVHQGRKLVADLKDREGRSELMTASSKEKLLQSRDPSDVTKFVSMRGVPVAWISMPRRAESNGLPAPRGWEDHVRPYLAYSAQLDRCRLTRFVHSLGRIPLFGSIASVCADWKRVRSTPTVGPETDRSKPTVADPPQASFATRHMRERCGTDALIGSMCVFGMTRLILAPVGDSGSYPGSPSSLHACHQPYGAHTTLGSSASLYFAFSLILPATVSTLTHSPSSTRKPPAVSG
jgi:hypothetical protein